MKLVLVRRRLWLGVRLLGDVILAVLVGALVLRLGVLAFTLTAWPFRLLAAGLAIGVGHSLARVCTYKSAQWRTRLGLLATH